eukprot:scaffold2988_cov123-Isochrysis_galbana.AAC.5
MLVWQDHADSHAEEVPEGDEGRPPCEPAGSRESPGCETARTGESDASARERARVRPAAPAPWPGGRTGCSPSNSTSEGPCSIPKGWCLAVPPVSSSVEASCPK